MSDGNGAPQRLLGSFAEGGEEYDRLRPTYPVETVDLVAPGSGLDVVDVGAGTGKLTRLLVERGHRVVAVEPSASMRVTLARVLPQVRLLKGTGERTGLPDGCADVVTYAQSWHWADPQAAGREACRVLRPGGALAMVWNMFDSTIGWVADLERAMHASSRAWRPEPAGGVQARPPGGDVGAVRRDLVRWADPVPLEHLRLQVRTRSYYLEGTARERALIDAEVEEALRLHFPGAAPGEVVEIPYVTTVDRYETVGRATEDAAHRFAHRRRECPGGES